MKLRFVLPLLLGALAFGTANLPAADDGHDHGATPAQPALSPVASEMKDVVAKIQTKMREGKKTEADLAVELKEFDAILAKHKDEKTDDVAQVLYMKAMLYAQVFEDDEKAAELINQLKKDFPETKRGKDADNILASMEQQKEAKKIQKSLAPGTKFPDFEEKDLDGKALSIANYKGKVVLIDFWAVWCGPCVAELPNVLKAYEAYHGKGFEIIGISLDRDEKKLKDFLEEKKMTWPQYFDGKGWENKLAAKYGVKSIPATYLLDGEGKIIDKNLRGKALEEAVAKALEKKS
jgi:peroxiredoxin